MDEYGKKFMDEQLNFDGMKFIHVIIVFRKTLWLGTFVVVGWPLIMILMTFYILIYSNNVNAIMVTFGSLLSPWLTIFPRHHAFCKKGTKHFFL
jgi:hypothetical protein